MKLEAANTTRHIKWWQIALIAVVVLAVAGAIIFSLVYKNTDTVKAGSNGDNLSNVSNTGNNVPASPDLSNLTWVNSVNTTLATKDYVFIFIPGSSDDLNSKAETELASAFSKIENQGVKLAAMTIDQKNPEYSSTVSAMSSVQLPAVFLVNNTGKGLIVPSDITETKLFQAFLTLAKACAPGSGSGCCP